MKQRALLLLPFLFACGGRSEVLDLGRAPAPDGFAVTTTGLSSPVVGFDAWGQMFTAAIDDELGWPVFLRSDGTTIPFPDAAGGATELAMVVGPDDAVHAVWVADRALYYGHLLPSQPRLRHVIRLQESPASGPTIAVSNQGEVFIAFAHGHISREPNMYVAAYRGSSDIGFVGPVRVMPECCDTYRGDAWGVHVGQALFDEGGSIHLAYSWSGNESWTDYVQEGRSYYLAQRVPAVAAFVDHASLLPPPAGMLFTVNAAQDRLDLNHVDRGAPAAILEAPGISVTQAAREEGGVTHVLANRWTDAGGVIEYLSNARGAWSRTVVASSGIEASIHLTPRAGGFAEHGGKRYIAFTRASTNSPLRSIEVVEVRAAD